MKLSSPKISFDNRLLAIEEQFRQRKFSAALHDLSLLTEDEFRANPPEHGLYLSLAADGCYWEGNYRQAIENALRGASILADYPLNRRYGRVQLILAKSYTAIGDMKNAEIRARDALSAYRRAGDMVGQVEALNNAARVTYIRCDYAGAVAFLEEAIGMLDDNPRKLSQSVGNLGTLRIHLGQWEQADTDLNQALEINQRLHYEASQAVNLLSLGILALVQRKFVSSRRRFEEALDLIERQGLKREKVIALKYAGELAYEKGDIFKAKALLINAYQAGLVLAPDSALVSQASRRLADVELALDNLDDAMKHGQKGLELASALGEKVEVALSKRVIARVYAARGEFDDALDNIRQAIETIRQIGDPYELARSLLTYTEIAIASGSEDARAIRVAFEEAYRIFKKLRLDYWMAETEFQTGVFACQQGDLSAGFRKLNRAEKIFLRLDENSKVRGVHHFLQSLSEQAVALSISQENEYKIFGNLISPGELTDLKTSQLDDILSILLKKTGGDRAVIYSPESEGETVVASLPLTSYQQKKFGEGFSAVLGEEILKIKPTLNLDCRRDPFINNLLTDIPDVVASILVVPFRMSNGTVSYLYLDRLTHDNSLNPFGQTDLNFAVGFSDLIAFKWAEIEKNRLLEDNRRLKSQLMEKAAFPNIITRNHDMLDLLSQVRQVINSNISVSIEGETGTGKDIVARAIHYNSNRRARRFISVNCAALPETLLESELFGYKRGAFTGADRDKAGLFEEADGGTFFLDEIADMPLSIQAKILRVLEAKEIVRLGDSMPRQVDVRIISATNKDLREQMAAKTFRQDLYYRLSALSFRLPPLRDRREDIPLLVSYFLEGIDKEIDADVMRLLLAYDWPGNVRELENEIKKLALLAGERPIITLDQISGKLRGVADHAVGTTPSISPDEVEFNDEYSLYDYLAEHEKQFIIRALKDKRGVKKHAAAALNIPESTLRLKIKQYNIDPKRLDAIN